MLSKGACDPKRQNTSQNVTKYAIKGKRGVHQYCFVVVFSEGSTLYQIMYRNAGYRHKIVRKNNKSRLL